MPFLCEAIGQHKVPPEQVIYVQDEGIRHFQLHVQYKCLQKFQNT